MSSPDPNSPLTTAHLEQIRNALDIIAITEQQIATAKRAGIDVSEQERMLNESRDKLLRIKNAYFPGM